MKRFYLAGLFFVLFWSFAASGQVAFPGTSTLPPVVGQIRVGSEVVVAMKGNYLAKDGWEGRVEEKFFLHVEKITIALPPLGIHPRITITGSAYDRYQKLVGLFKADITALSLDFCQFSIVLNKQDGTCLSYGGDLFVITEDDSPVSSILFGGAAKVKGTFISEMTTAASGLPLEIGRGKVNLSLEK
jgi:hypothetical protein